MTSYDRPTSTTPAAHSDPGPVGSALSTALVAGLLLGGLDLALQVTLPYPLANLADSSAVWAVVAFLVVRVLGVSPAWSAACGVLLLAVASEAYYVLAWVVGLGSWTRALSPTAASWATIAVVAGVVFGVAAAWSRDHQDTWAGAAALALGSGVLVAEALLRLLSLGSAASWDRGDLLVTAVLTALLGIALLGLAVDSPRQLPRAALLVAPMALLCLVGFRLAGFGG